MRIISGVVPGVSRLARLQVELSKKARQRLKWFDTIISVGKMPASPVTTLTSTRRPSIAGIKEEYPRWGKDKLVVLVREEGFNCSTSMVGRIIRRLKDRGVLVEPVRNHVSAHRRGIRRPYAIRKPKDYQVSQPGDLIQLDTLDIRPLPGVVLKHFTARDIISRWDVIDVNSRATASTAARFLDRIEQRMPFIIRAIQVDGGSEFEAVFEEECWRRDIKLFVLPPHSPKLNGYVERAHRTHTEEFYEVTESSFDLAELRGALLEWEKVYNIKRPHQALGYMTPLKFPGEVEEKSRKGGYVSLIIWTSTFHLQLAGFML